MKLRVASLFSAIAFAGWWPLATAAPSGLCNSGYFIRSIEYEIRDGDVIHIGAELELPWRIEKGATLIGYALPHGGEWSLVVGETRKVVAEADGSAWLTSIGGELKRANAAIESQLANSRYLEMLVLTKKFPLRNPRQVNKPAEIVKGGHRHFIELSLEGDRKTGIAAVAFGRRCLQPEGEANVGRCDYEERTVWTKPHLGAPWRRECRSVPQ